MSPLIALKIAASTVQVPFELLRAICTVESKLDPLAINKFDGNSPSHGMCQVKYETAKGVGFRGKLKDLYKARINALYAAKYLKYQLVRYGNNWIKATSAYNRGTASSKNNKYVRKVFATILKEDLNVRSIRYSNPKHPSCTGIHANAF